MVDAVRTSAAEDDIRLSPRARGTMAELREFLFDNVYTCDVVMEEVAKAMRLIDVLFSYCIENPGEIPVEYRAISEGDDVRAATDYRRHDRPLCEIPLPEPVRTPFPSRVKSYDQPKNRFASQLHRGAPSCSVTSPSARRAAPRLH